jgi:hypothetical protein
MVMKRQLVEFLIKPVRHHLSDLDFDEPIYSEGCQRANHLVMNKYRLCKIFALFEVIFDFVLMRVPVFGKEQFHVLIIPCQMKKSLRLDTEDTKSVNSRFVRHTPLSITVPRCN